MGKLKERSPEEARLAAERLREIYRRAEERAAPLLAARMEYENEREIEAGIEPLPDHWWTGSEREEEN